MAGQDRAREEQAFDAAVRSFSERYLPSRGWSRVLELGAGSGGRAALLAERGYSVTIVEADESALNAARNRLEANGLEASYLLADGFDRSPADEYDVIVCFDPSIVDADAARAAAALRSSLRKRGLLFGGPAFQQRSRRLKRLGYRIVRDFGSEFPAFRVRGRIGKLVGRLTAR